MFRKHTYCLHFEFITSTKLLYSLNGRAANQHYIKMCNSLINLDLVCAENLSYSEFIPFTSVLSLQPAIVSLCVCGVSRVCTTHVTYTIPLCMPFGCKIKTKARMEMVVCYFLLFASMNSLSCLWARLAFGVHCVLCCSIARTVFYSCPLSVIHMLRRQCSCCYAGTSRFLLTVAKCTKHNFPQGQWWPVGEGYLHNL